MALEIRQQIKIKGSTLSEDPILYFDNTGTAPSLAAITVDSFGSGTSGDMIFQTAQSGTLTQALRINNQGRVYVGTGTADVSAVFQVDSLIDGFLPPRNPDPGTNISTPANGLIAYDSTDDELQYYNGTSWVSLTGISGYLPLAGGTMSGDILFTAGDINLYDGDAGTASKLKWNDDNYIEVDVNGPGGLSFYADSEWLFDELSTTKSYVLGSGAIGYYDTGVNGVLTFSNITGIRNWTLPDATGTIALVSSFFTVPNTAPLTETINWANGSSQEVDFELKGAGIVAFTLSNPVNGESYTLKITQGANLNTINWPASIKWEGATPLIPTAADNAIDVVTMVYNGTDYFASYGTNFN